MLFWEVNHRAEQNRTADRTEPDRIYSLSGLNQVQSGLDLKNRLYPVRSKPFEKRSRPD